MNRRLFLMQLRAVGKSAHRLQGLQTLAGQAEAQNRRTIGTVMSKLDNLRC